MAAAASRPPGRPATAAPRRRSPAPMATARSMSIRGKPRSTSMIRQTPLVLAMATAFAVGLGAANAAPPTAAPMGNSTTGGAPSGAMAPTAPTSSSATGGTGGSAAVGGTSASTLGLGATTTSPSGTESAIGTGGSAAGGNRDTSSSKVNGNANNLHGMSKARAQD